MVKEKLRNTSNAEYNIYACTVVTIQVIAIHKVVPHMPYTSKVQHKDH
jgi:hypothetical protein